MNPMNEMLLKYNAVNQINKMILKYHGVKYNNFEIAKILHERPQHINSLLGKIPFHSEFIKNTHEKFQKPQFKELLFTLISTNRLKEVEEMILMLPEKEKSELLNDMIYNLIDKLSSDIDKQHDKQSKTRIFEAGIAKIESLLSQILFKKSRLIQLIVTICLIHNDPEKAKQFALMLKGSFRAFALEKIAESHISKNQYMEAFALAKEELSERDQNHLIHGICLICRKGNIPILCQYICDLPHVDLSKLFEWTDNTATVEEVESFLFAGARFKQEELAAYYQKNQTSIADQQRIARAFEVQAKALQMTALEVQAAVGETLSCMTKVLLPLISDYAPDSSWKEFYAQCVAIKTK